MHCAWLTWGDCLEMAKNDYKALVGEVLTDYNREIMQVLNNVRRRSAVHTDDEVRERASQYFDACADVGRLPDLASLALALGISKGTMENWARGIACSAARKEVIQWCYTMVEAAQLQASTVGGFNPILWMFLAKSKYGYREDGTIAGFTDRAVIESGASVDEIQNRYNTPLPVTLPSLEEHIVLDSNVDDYTPGEAEPIESDSAETDTAEE